MSYRLSICIPTFNRADLLGHCLRWLYENRAHMGSDVQVCISDNCSTDATAEVIRSAQQHMPIKYRRNETNIGLVPNIMQAAAMADGDFVWMIGNDDLVMPGAVDRLLRVLTEQPHVDYVFANAANLPAARVLTCDHEFSAADLPRDLPLWSHREDSGPLPFLDLIDPRVSFDFLGGIFLSVFRRSSWIKHLDILDQTSIASAETFSCHDNTFPHVKIFAAAFARSTAYYSAEPLTVCLSGAREWAPLYPLVRSVRMVESLERYRLAGLSRERYWRLRNATLRYFLPDMIWMYRHRDQSGFRYLSPLSLLRQNALFPNTYLSVIYFIARKMMQTRLALRRSS